MTKVILQLYPTLRAENEQERERLRPLGRNNERFQEFIETLPQVAQACDDLGLWGIATIEHHFHSEGYEVGPNPTALGIHLAGLTKRVRVGQLGYTMSAQNPFRVAEDTALLDHITNGRCFVGFSRGYQSRWTNVFGQHLGVAGHALSAGLHRRTARPVHRRAAACTGSDRPGQPGRVRGAGGHGGRRLDQGMRVVQHSPVEGSVSVRRGHRVGHGAGHRTSGCAR